MAKKPTYEELAQKVKELEKEVVDRKATEEAFQETLEKYRVVFETAKDAIFICDETGRFVDVNQAACESLGYSRKELLQLSNKEIDADEKGYDAFVKVRNGSAESMTFEVNQRRKDGTLLPIEITGSFFDCKGERMAVAIARNITEHKQAKEMLQKAHDKLDRRVKERTAELSKVNAELKQKISEHKQAEEALRASVLSWDTTFDAMTDSVCLIDVEGKILQCNKATANFLGKPINEIVGNTCWELVHGTLEPIKGCPIVRMRETLRQESLELAVGDRVLYVVTDPIFDQDGKIAKAVHTITDITERKQAEEALRESEERFRTVAEFTYDWEDWLAPDGQFIYISPSCERITGYSPEEFMTDPGLFEKIVHPDDHSMVVSHIHGEQNLEEVFPIDFRIITRSGEKRWISHNCQPVYDTDGNYLGRRASNRDITKRKKMQEELLKTKKLESLGALAGGIAHDFNNMLTSVLGNISLAQMETEPGTEVFELLTEAEKAGKRVKELTARLITFSSGGEPVKKVTSIGDLVKDSVSSMLSDSNIDCEFSIPDDLSPTEIDEQQMKQVIYSITSNAQEAMTAKGTIKVYCENVIVGEEDALTLRKGKYVRISIEDQGAGIPKEDLQKIFDPYFSTKEMGTRKGMGLGLAVCHSIVEKHDGLITVESELGAGTTFIIYLPAPEKEIAEPEPIKKVVPARPVTGRGKILVMDDEEMLRNVFAALLNKLGYEVALAIDGVEAIEIYKRARESGEPFDVVILDLTNQFGMGGKEAIQKLLEIDPDVKAIIASGYSYDPIMSDFVAYGFRGVLAKPFTMDELSGALNGAITGEDE